MSNKIQIEMLYESKRKSKLIAYLIGAIGGSFGLHLFYLKHNEYACLVLALLGLSILVPQLMIIHVIVVLSGVIHTNYLVDNYNIKTRVECELLME